MEVQIISKRQLQKYIDGHEYVKEYLSIANTIQFAEYKKSIVCTPLFLIMKREEAVCAVWCIYKILTQKGFLLYANDFISITNPTESFQDIFDAAIAYMKKRYKGRKLLVSDYTLARNTDKNILIKNGFKNVTCYYAYINKIDGDEENLKTFHASHRQDTRKAIKEGYLYKENISSREYYQLSKETYGRSRMHGMSLHHIKKIRKSFNKNILISGVYCDGKLTAASIVPFNGKKAVYLAGASASIKPRGATSYLQYMNMNKLRERGIEYYDFAGACIEGEEGSEELKKALNLKKFKERFGGVETIHYAGEIEL